MKLQFLSLLLIVSFTATRCIKDDSTENNKPELLIKDASTAKSAAEYVNSACEKVISTLPSGNYQQSYNISLSSKRIDGPYGGYCIVNGSTTRTYSSSSSYVSDQHKVDVTISFYNYIIYSGSNAKVENGSVDLYDYSSSSTYASGNYSSSSSRSISGSNVKLVSDGIADTFSLDITQGNSYIIKGSLTSTNGKFVF